MTEQRTARIPGMDSFKAEDGAYADAFNSAVRAAAEDIAVKGSFADDDKEFAELLTRNATFRRAVEIGLFYGIKARPDRCIDATLGLAQAAERREVMWRDRYRVLVNALHADGHDPTTLDGDPNCDLCTALRKAHSVTTTT